MVVASVLQERSLVMSTWLDLQQRLCLLQEVMIANGIPVLFGQIDAQHLQESSLVSSISFFVW